MSDQRSPELGDTPPTAEMPAWLTEDLEVTTDVQKSTDELLFEKNTEEFKAKLHTLLEVYKGVMFRAERNPLPDTGKQDSRVGRLGALIQMYEGALQLCDARNMDNNTLDLIKKVIMDAHRRLGKKAREDSLSSAAD
jgi:hypothetical protein